MYTDNLDTSCSAGAVSAALGFAQICGALAPLQAPFNQQCFLGGTVAPVLGEPLCCSQNREVELFNKLAVGRTHEADLTFVKLLLSVSGPGQESQVIHWSLGKAPPGSHL